METLQRHRLLPTASPFQVLEGVSLSAPLEAGPATGGGWVVRVTRARGLTGAWRGREPFALPDPEASLPGLELRLFPGGWLRSLEGGGRELGVLADVEGGPVIARAASATESTESVVVVLLPEGAPVEAAITRLRPLPARILQRLDRADSGEGPALGLSLAGTGARRLQEHFDAALRALDDAPLAPPGSRGSGFPLLLRGLGAEGPTFLSAGEGAELGLTALVCGRFPLARTLLTQAAAVPPTEGAHQELLLLLSARWALWTGEAEALLPLRPALDEAASAFGSRPDLLPAGAAFPSPPRLLELLANAVEPLGIDGWRDSFLRRAAELRAIARQGPGARGRVLPVIGAVAAPSTDPLPVPDDPTLPSPGAFGGVDGPGFAPARTVHAARLLRSWIEGAFGVEPDAHYGRVRVAPDLRVLAQNFSLAGLRVGDASIRIDCRGTEAGHSFLLRQEGGRVPLNLIFEPRLPPGPLREVRLEDAPIEVESIETGAEHRVRLQFPLDPQRRVHLVGAS